MGKTCVICGKPSGMYPLCREHLKMKAEGKVVKCEDCGVWHLANKQCPVCSQDDEKEISFTKSKKVVSVSQKSYKKCLLCDNEVTDDFLFFQPFLNSPFMGATFEFADSCFWIKPTDVIEILEWFRIKVNIFSLIDISRIIKIFISM